MSVRGSEPNNSDVDSFVSKFDANETRSVKIGVFEMAVLS